MREKIIERGKETRMERNLGAVSVNISWKTSLPITVYAYSTLVSRESSDVRIIEHKSNLVYLVSTLNFLKYFSSFGYLLLWDRKSWAAARTSTALCSLLNYFIIFKCVVFMTFTSMYHACCVNCVCLFVIQSQPGRYWKTWKGRQT
jgi:hypothetical protein